MNKKNILIITPPLTSTAMPSFTAAYAAGCFSCEDVDTDIYDANLDFFINHAFSKRVLEKGFKTLMEKKEMGLIPNDKFKVLDAISQSLSNHCLSIDFFKSETFYDPEKYVAIKKRLNELLLLYSAPFYPSRIRWRSLSCIDREDIIFWSFCKERLDLILKKHVPDVVLLVLDSCDQVLAVNTIIQYIKEFFPTISSVVLQGENHFENNVPDADHCFSTQKLSVFFDWIAKSFKGKHQDIPIEPDFSKFPLAEYLAPDLILPLHSAYFKNMLHLWDVVAKLKNRFGAKGFLFDGPLSSFYSSPLRKEFSDLYFGIQAAAEDLEKTIVNNEKQNVVSAGALFIQWKQPGEKNSFKVKELWNISKQGIWNHFNLKGFTDDTIKNEWLRFISLNPNIVHSFENLIDPVSYGTPDRNGIDSSLQGYSGVKPLPGEPFWTFLLEPVHLLHYLNRYGKKTLFCLRAEKMGEPPVTLGRDITFHFKRADDLPPGFLEEICAMVEAGGSVDTKYVRYNLERAYLIGYAVENGVIIGTSSLKHPRQEFINRLNGLTGFNFNDFVERGYTSVRPEYRALGVGARLLSGLTERVGEYKIFSIIDEENTATHKIAGKNRTKKIAVYYSEKVGKELGVWMPEQMIDKKWKLKL